MITQTRSVFPGAGCTVSGATVLHGDATSDKEAAAALATERMCAKALKGEGFVMAVNRTDEDLVSWKPTVNIMTKGGDIKNMAPSETFIGEDTERRVVVNVRAFNAAFGSAGGITNNQPSLLVHLGKGAVLDDTATFNICSSKGDINNNNPMRNYFGKPPPDFSWSTFH